MKPNVLPSFRIMTVVLLGWAGLVVAVSGYSDGKTGKASFGEREARPVPVGKPVPQPGKEQPAEMRLVRSWQTFSVDDGLPSRKITTVTVDKIREWVWVGTDKGLAVYRGGKWDVMTTEEGLSHNFILGIDISEVTGEVWIATMGGLNRWSAGEIRIYDQFNSGLANDVVYAVVTDSQHVWAATAAGASRFNIYTDQWDIFNEQNAPMHEPWTYGIAKGEEKIYIAAWGGGVIEYFKQSGRFRVHRDPDHQMEIDLYPDDGIVHDVITGVSYEQGVLWAGTYFGLSRYDGTHWNSYFEEDSGLASNFINQVKASGRLVFVCTDKGLSVFDGQQWATYVNRESKGEIILSDGRGRRTVTAATSIPDNYVWGMDIAGDELWVATENGLARGIISSEPVGL